jgi:hypothetical protein
VFNTNSKLQQWRKRAIIQPYGNFYYYNKSTLLGNCNYFTVPQDLNSVADKSLKIIKHISNPGRIFGSRNPTNNNMYLTANRYLSFRRLYVAFIGEEILQSLHFSGEISVCCTLELSSERWFASLFPAFAIGYGRVLFEIPFERYWPMRQVFTPSHPNMHRMNGVLLAIPSTSKSSSLDR